MKWTGIKQGVDPSEDTESTAHRYPEASTSQDPALSSDAWAPYFQIPPAADASTPYPRKQSEVAVIGGEYSQESALQLLSSSHSFEPEWSEPVELRPCSVLVAHPALSIKNGKLSLEDTVEDTLEALKQGEYYQEDDDGCAHTGRTLPSHQSDVG